MRCAAVDPGYTHFATAGDDKQLKVWALDTLQLLSERCATCPPVRSFSIDLKYAESSPRSRLRSRLRVPAEQSLSRISLETYLRVLGKPFSFFSPFTHRFESYPLTPLPTTTPAPALPTEVDALATHENPFGGTLILGHTSLLTAFLFSPDETHVITADRDEHIRASRFPQGYIIESFCLGHKKYTRSPSVQLKR